VIGEMLRQILAHNGGILFLQQLALLGSVYGFVDVLVKLDTVAGDADATTTTSPSDSIACGAYELGAPPVEQQGDAPVGDDNGETPPRPGDAGRTRVAGDAPPQAPTQRLARMVRFEIVEPARALPFLCETDYRAVTAYGQCFEIAAPQAQNGETASGKR